MMKRFLFITIFGLFFCISSWADRQPIVIQNGGAVGDHGEYFDPADKPELYYDVDNQEIILVADGFLSSYDVNIVSLSTLQLALHSTANGYGDIIDVSSLPDDDYKIVITTPYNNVYEGYFTNY